jgi:putative endonuclease
MMSKINSKLISYYLGHIIEYFVCFILILKLYSIQKRRYRSPFGEVDIIALKNGQLVFVEVKYRKRLIHKELVSFKTAK